MKKLNKFILGAASVAAVAAPVATVVSCGTNEKDKEPTVALVTDGGSVQDKSFNEQGGDALKEIKGVTKLTSSMFNQPSGSDAAAISSGYQSFAANGVKTILAPGYAQAAAIELWNKSGIDKMNFILVDAEVKERNVASVVFDSKEPSFLAGYLAAKYVATKFSNEADRKVATFGGGDFDGVKNIMIGFVEGVKFWNDQDTQLQRKVKFVDLNSSWLNTGFNAGNGKTVADNLVKEGAKVILPVAGGETADVISAIKNSQKSDVKIIGVDTDQSKTYAEDASLFLTSILKNVAKAFVDTYKQGNTAFGTTTVGTLSNQLVGLVDPVITEASSIYSEISIAGNPVNTAAASQSVKDKTWEQAKSDMTF